MKPLPSLLVLSLLLAGTAAVIGGENRVPPPAGPCEPAAEIDLYARVISRTDLGTSSRVFVELTVFPWVSLPSAKVHGSVAGGAGFDEAFQIQDAVVPLRRWATRKFLYDLTLEGGREHHLLFTVGPADAPGTAPESAAYLRVNLDPSLQPEELDGLLQYRARMEGR